MKICITHIKNEEYLLPWWIMNHINKFDMVYVIDYNSTDNSLNIIREMAPHWVVLQSRYEKFGAVNCDQQVMELERHLFEQYEKPVIIALTITEFLVGNTEFLDNVGNEDYVKYILAAQMCDIPENFFKEPDPKLPLIEQRTHGLRELYYPTNPMETKFWLDCAHLKLGPRMMRCIHNIPVKYNTGRHYWCEPVEHRLLNASYSYSPFTQKMVDRKCQIQHNIAESDKISGLGFHHLNLNLESIQQRAAYLMPHIKDLKDYFLELENLR